MSIAAIRMTGKQMNEAVRILDKYGWEKLSPFMETWQIEMERDKKTEVFFEVQQNVAEIMREVGCARIGVCFPDNPHTSLCLYDDRRKNGLPGITGQPAITIY